MPAWFHIICEGSIIACVLVLVVLDTWELGCHLCCSYGLQMNIANVYFGNGFCTPCSKQPLCWTHDMPVWFSQQDQFAEFVLELVVLDAWELGYHLCWAYELQMNILNVYFDNELCTLSSSLIHWSYDLHMSITCFWYSLFSWI